MKTITFTCETITPMFLSGADQNIPELRPPSIKGALRFWWRAMNGHLDLKDKKDEQGNLIKGLKTLESEIFGGTEPAQRSKVIVRVSHSSLNKSSNKLNGEKVHIEKWVYDRIVGKEVKRDIPIDLLEYLCYGTYEYERGKGNVFTREYFLPNQQFEVNFIFIDNQYVQEVVNAFCLIANFGGLGSRSRNGFGNFKVVSSDIDLPTQEDLLKKLKKGNKASFTAFSNDIRIFKTTLSFPIVNDKGIKQNDVWKKALSKLASAYRVSRSSLETKHTYNKRIYIASPLIADNETHSFLDRHSKSFFLSIIEENGQYNGVILYLPYLYLEGNTNYNKKRRENYDEFNTKFCELLLQNQLTEITI
ncbi:MAG: type III-B CRISPR module RAMP protein Cmr1 [Bacteroidetes bacterium]|nr:MAG: type III-B CRISPR module RAMP protein Cmr1 [Bacteroidota bacterium]TAG92383.1 MAG: type III-B CRISPR module RAMP protein Cmr1 [Bacteroidota bacterium]